MGTRSGEERWQLLWGYGEAEASTFPSLEIGPYAAPGFLYLLSALVRASSCFTIGLGYPSLSAVALVGLWISDFNRITAFSFQRLVTNTYLL
jgi:hypothetical protein